MQIPTFQPHDIKINFSMLPPPFLQNFTSRHYHYLIPRHNHRASIIITRNRRAHSFYPEHNDINQPQKRFHAELRGNERNVLFFSSTFSIFPLSLSFSPSFFFLSLHFSARFSRSRGRALVPPFEHETVARLNCRRFSMGAAVDRGENSPGGNLFIFTAMWRPQREEKS